HVEHDRLLGDAQRVVPRQDYRGGAEIDVRAQRGQIGHQLQIVGAERIVVEVVFDRPEHVEAELFSKARPEDLFLPRIIVATAQPPKRGYPHWDADAQNPLQSERDRAIASRHYRLAALAKLGVAAAVAHDPADLLALDIAVDAGHPRVDLGEQQPLARRDDVVGPSSGARRGSFDTGQVAVAYEADQPGHPIGTVFGGAREVAEPRMRAHDHQHVGEAVHQDSEKGLRSVLPLVLQRHPIDAPDIDAVEGAGDRVEAGRVNDDVELVLGIAGPDAGRGDALDRRLGDVDQLD